MTTMLRPRRLSSLALEAKRPLPVGMRLVTYAPFWARSEGMIQG